MMLRAFFTACLLLWVDYCHAAGDVVSITDKNYAEYKDSEYMLLELFAPWCGHCKKLNPEYEKAAKTLKKQVPDVVIAQCDGTEESATAEKLDVRGYPTLKWFRAGTITDYSGERTEEGIVEWVTRKSKPAVQVLLDSDDHASFVASAEVIAVFYGPAEGAAYEVFAKVADAAEAIRYAVGGADLLRETPLAKDMLPETPALLLHRTFDVQPAIFSHVFSERAVADFVAVEALNPVIEFKQENMAKIFETHSGLNLFHILLFSDPSTSYHTETVSALSSAYGGYKGRAINVLVDATAEDSKRVIDFFNIDVEELPTVRAFKQAQNKKYQPDSGSEDLTKEFFMAFAEQVAAEKLTPILKTETAPAASVGPVTVVVGTTFKRIVLDEEKTVLLEVYAPWCGHCKSLAPAYEEVAKNYAKNPDVVIAKMDGTANEVEDLQVDGFPMLKLYPSGKANPENAATYEGERAAAEIIAFVDNYVPASKTDSKPPNTDNKSDL